MRKGLLFFLLLILQISAAAIASTHFTTCKSKYALCTTAACTKMPGKRGIVSCNCDVKEGYSVGQQQCQGVKKTEHGQLVYSRYYPIKRYVVCSNKRPWAWCLDKPCIVNKKDPTRANCACTLVKNLGKYIIVTDKYSPTTCTTGIISSATIKQSKQVTDYLKTQKNLQPFPIDVIKAP